MKASARTWIGTVSRLAAASASLVVVACGDPRGGVGDRLASTSSAITQDRVIPTGEACTPTGRHVEHNTFGCATCHQCEGTVSFDPAVAGPNAAFDATTKTCSNVACHGFPAGTYTYYTWDWAIEDVVAVTIPYGGEEGAGAASWYADPGTTSCDACHGYPTTYAGVARAWHSGVHAYSFTPNGNACQLCHPHVKGAYVYGGLPSYVGTSGGLVTSCPPGTFCAAQGTILDASLHRNGVVDVSATFSSTCNGCH